MEQNQETQTDSHLFSKEKIIDHGTRSVCYRDGDKVYKIMSGISSEKAASQSVEELNKSRDILTQWLGEYVTPSKIEKLEKNGEFKIITEQPFIEGVSLQKAVELAQKENLNLNNIVDFLEKALSMYKNTNQVPDIFGRPHILGWYQVLSTPNVKVEIKDGVLTPRLLDVGFARLSTNTITKSIHNSLLAKSIEDAIKVTKNQTIN